MKKVRAANAKKNKRRLYQSSVILSTGLDSAGATTNLGGQLAKQNLPRLWLLRGDLGAGKTTLVRGVLRELGVRQRVTSPTFNLIKVYPVKKHGLARAVHVDAYRIKSRHELAALDLGSFLTDKKTLVLIEWPERLHKRWRGPLLKINLKHRQHGRWAQVRNV